MILVLNFFLPLFIPKDQWKLKSDIGGGSYSLFPFKSELPKCKTRLGNGTALKTNKKIWVDKPNWEKWTPPWNYRFELKETFSPWREDAGNCCHVEEGRNHVYQKIAKKNPSLHHYIRFGGQKGSSRPPLWFHLNAAVKSLCHEIKCCTLERSFVTKI